MDTTSSSRFPIAATASVTFHRSMSNCALRSFSQLDDDDSDSSATSTTRGRRRFRRVRSSQQLQQQQQHQQFDSPRQSNVVEWISSGMYEVAILTKEEASRPPNTSISDQALYKEHNNLDTSDFRENNSDESSISSMSSYGDYTTTNTNRKSEVILIEAVDDTNTTDISSDDRNVDGQGGDDKETLRHP
jgi:hypothetical protein